MGMLGTSMLRGKVVVVAGGATPRGRGISRLLASHGASVIVHGGADDPVCELVREIEAAGGQAAACRADLATVEGAEALLQLAVTTFGKLDLVIGSAASLVPVTEHDAPRVSARWRRRRESGVSRT